MRGDIGECAIAVIVVEVRHFPFVCRLRAIAGLPIIRAVLRPVERELHIIRDKQIETAVTVVIKPCGACAPLAGIANSGFLGDIGECAIAVVVVESA